MLYAGEDPRFIFRRMLIFAGEDVGMADPNAMHVVAACAQAFDYVGLPEGRFHLAEACIYLATAPKSNSSFALFDAIASVEREREEEVPSHLKDASRDAEDLGHGQGYLYPHAYRDHWVAQQYLPESLQGRVFYQPTGQGYEGKIQEQVARRREAQLAAMLEEDHSPLAVADDRGHERMAGGPPAQNRWLQRTLSNVGDQLAAVRERVMAAAGIERHSLVLDLNAGSGLLTWEAVRRAPVGGVWALAADARSAEALRQQAANMESLARPVIMQGSLEEVPDLIARHGEGEVRFDVLLGRNALTHAPDKAAAARAIASLLGPGGRLALAETIPRHTQRLYRLVDLSALDEDVRRRLAAAEEAIYSDPDDALVNWDAGDLRSAFEAAGLSNVTIQMETVTAQQHIGPDQLARWFGASSDRQRPSYAQRLSRHLSAAEISRVQTLFERQLRERTVAWASQMAYLTAHK
jgi:putative ATPase